jgi:hypothetical protein
MRVLALDPVRMAVRVVMVVVMTIVFAVFTFRHISLPR